MRPRRDLKYMNATASASSIGGDVAGFGGDTPGSDGVGLGAPKNGNTEVGVDCADLGAASNAEGEGAGTAVGWAVNMNGFDAVVPAAPKPTNAPNLGGASSCSGYEELWSQKTRLTHGFVYVGNHGWQSIEGWWPRSSQRALGQGAYSETRLATWCTRWRRNGILSVG